MKIPWKYCECGCHAHVATLGGIQFSMLDNLRGTYYVSTQHHAHLYGKPFTSHEAADQHIQEILKERLKELKRQIEELEV